MKDIWDLNSIHSALIHSLRTFGFVMIEMGVSKKA